MKGGTPTAGGALLIAVVGALALVFNLVDASTFAPLAALGLVGALGFADDWLNASTGDGIRARQKLLWQTAVAVFAAWQIQRTYDIAAVGVPFVGAVPIAPWLYIVFAAFAIAKQPTARSPSTSKAVPSASGKPCQGMTIDQASTQRRR